MRRQIRHIGWLLGGMLMLLLPMTSCDTSEETQEKSTIKIYVFPPDAPIVTRADRGDVDAIGQESAVNSLHVWVFNNGTGEKVGYVNASSTDFSTSNQATLTMSVSDAFNDAVTKPNVDVYVAANVTATNCGITLSEETTRAELEAACIGSSYFGLTSLVTAVPADGLPMSGVLKNQVIGGSAPVFDAGTVKLVRTVSKVHFVFCRDSNDEVEHTVKSIKLSTGMIPTTEYLFLENEYSASGGSGTRYHVGSTYEGEATLMNTPTAIVTCNPDKSPGDFMWDPDATVPLTGQEYEDLIKEGLSIREGKTKSDLNDLGTYYLRETDKQIKGTITYKNGDVDQEPVEFSLYEPGDFTRNHTWIVYAYFTYTGRLDVITVKVKAWDTKQAATPEVYNW